MLDPGNNAAPKEEAPRIRALRVLRHWIESGELPPGEPLPPERELSRRLQVGRATLQRALTVLEAEGLIRFHGGHTRLVSGSRHAQGTALRSAVALFSYFRDPALYGRDAWSEATCRGALDETRGKGWNALSFYLDHMSPEEIVRVAADHPLGVLIPEGNYPLRRISPELLRKISSRGVNLVVCGDWPEWSAYDRVYSDHETGSYEITRWLIGQGCRRILMLWPEPWEAWWAQARREGHLRALAEVGVPSLEVQRMVPLPQPTTGERGTAERFEAESRYAAGYLVEHVRSADAIDAVLLPTDAHAFPVAAACRLLGRVPNHDIVIAGYDNDWAVNPYRRIEPAGPAVTVDRLYAEMGREMVRLLADRASGKLPRGGQRRAVAPKLIVTGQLRRTVEGPCEIYGSEKAVEI